MAPRRVIAAARELGARVAGSRIARGQVALLGRRALRGYLDDHGPQLAAAISYYAVFAVLPLAILLVAGFGLVYDDAESRNEATDFLLDNLPIAEDDGRDELERILRGVTGGAGALGLAALAGLVYASSGLMGSIRNALNTVWGTHGQRHFAVGKALDLLLVGAVGLLAGLSLAATVLKGFAVDLSQELERPLGPLGAALGAAVDATGALIPLALSAAIFATLYRVVPATSIPLRDLWPGVLFAAISYELAKRGFALYLEGFANYSAIYGSLGAVIAFLVFVSIAANVFLFGAEVASRWPGVRDAGPLSR